MSLARVSDGLIVLICVVLLAVLGLQQWQHHSDRRQLQRSTQRLVGLRLDLPMPRSDVTVILHLSSKCSYCTQSIPFYRQLVRVSRTSSRGLVIAAQFLSRTPGDAFLAAAGLSEVIDLGPMPRGFSTGYVPALLLADRHGNIVKAWTGFLTEGLQREVLREIRILCTDCEEIEP
jgi:hypothetical protein